MYAGGSFESATFGGSAGVFGTRIGRSCQTSPSLHRDVVGMRPGAFLVDEPVVDHELDPRGGDHVEDRGWLKGGAGQELEADLPRARRHEIGRVRERFAQRHVAPEPHARTAHAGTLEIVVRAIARAHVWASPPGGAVEFSSGGSSVS